MRLGVTSLLFCVLVAAAPADTSAQARDEASVAPLLWQPSMNVFRRFSVEREKMIEFYGDVLALRPMAPIGMPGGGQMTRFQVGTSEIKLTTAQANRQSPSGGIHELAGLRVLTFFFPDQAALTARFAAHGYPAPEFRKVSGTGDRSVAMVRDPDGQWVELVVVPGAAAEIFDRIEVGLTVSDLERSRGFYRDFVGLEELQPVTDVTLNVTKYPYRHGTTTINVWTFGKGLPVNTYSAGIQYVVSDAEGVDTLARARGVTIDQPLGNTMPGLRTVWLGDPDGITNYFAETGRSRTAAASR